MDKTRMIADEYMKKKYDKRFQVVFTAIKEIFDKFEETDKPKGKIGFYQKD